MTQKKGALAACTQCGRMTLVLDAGNHVCERCQHPRAVDELLVLRRGQTFRDWGRTVQLDPSDPKVELIDQFTCYLRDSNRGQEIVRRWPWLWNGVQQIEDKIGALTFEQVRSRINRLLKRLSLAKGKRHTVESSKARQDAPYWRDEKLFGATEATSEDHTGGRQVNDGTLRRDDALRTDQGHTVKGRNDQGLTAERRRNEAKDGATCQANGNTEQDTINPTHQRNENMPIFVEAPQAFELVDRGEHPAMVTTISEPEVSKFGPDKQSIRITFELTGGSFEGQRLSKYYTLSLSKMSGLGKVYRTLLGAIEAGERVDIERLIGQDCAIQVTHKLGDDDENYAVIQDVFKPAKSGKGAQKELVGAGAEVPF